MGGFDVTNRNSGTTGFDTPYSGEFPVPIIENERDWRIHPSGAHLTSARPRIVTTRWRTGEQRTREVSAETSGDSHLISIILRNENVLLSVSGRVVHDGVAVPGTLQVTAPAVPARCLFRGPYDVLHLHVPNSLVAEFARDLFGGKATLLCPGATPTRDPMAESLGRTLLEANEIGGSFGQLYADSVNNAILARLLSLSRRTGPSPRPRASALVKWRLRRAVDYIEAHLAEPVTLADIASATGLTRMHFAAQFRAATGLRPHEYLLRQRIERAQEMLVGTALPLVDIALSVGFHTQSQFTTVFKRFTGRPPRAWRQSYEQRTILDRSEIR